MLGLSKPQNIPSEPTSGGEPSDAIVLISFPRRFETCSSATPFGGKVELMLRIAGLPYVGYYGDVTNKNLAPRSKVATCCSLSPLKSWISGTASATLRMGFTCHLCKHLNVFVHVLV